MAQWFVDNAAVGTNNGTSWANAWTSFASIVWVSIAAGDTLFISGGTVSQTYSELLTIGGSGGAGNPITITVGLDIGHAGTAIIDGGTARDCINTNSKTNLVIQNLTLQNCGGAGGAECLFLHDVTTGSVVVQSLVIHTGLGSGGAGIDARGIDCRNNSATVTVQNCTVDTPASTTSQTDGIFTQNNSGGNVVIQNNAFVINNTDSTGHSDGWQSNQDVSLTFRNNLISHPNGGTNNHGIIIQDVAAGGEVDVYNNVLIMGNTPGTAANAPEVAIFREFLTVGFTGVVKFWNNTIYGGLTGYETFQTAGALPANDEFKNNLIYALPISIAPYLMNSGNLTTPANTDNNLVYASNPNNMRISCAQTALIGAGKSTTSASTGLLYFEAQVGMVYTGGDTLIGIANATQSNTDWTGHTLNSAGYWWSDGGLWINGVTSVTKAATAVPGDLLAFAWDFTHSKVWIKNLTTGGGWNNDILANQDPATNTGGIPISTLNAGPYFISQSFNSSGSYSILNTGGSPFVGTVPAGFSAWGATTTWDANNISAPATLTSPIAFVSGVAYETFAGWKALGYDAHGVNADPLFVNSPANDLRVLFSSPATDAGFTIATVTTDKNGVTRPQGAAFDIGAFEALSGVLLPQVLM